MINSRDMQRFVPRLLFWSFILLWFPCLWGAAPVVNPGGMVNGASDTSSLAAGTFASVFGSNLATTTAFASSAPLPTTLGGSSVAINGIAAPLFMVSPTQINFQIPWELAGLTSASITVTTSGGTSSPVVFNLAAFAPGIFAVNASGSGQGDILNQADQSLAAPVGSLSNAHPAAPGGVIVIYGTGLGAVTNQPADGAAASSKSPSQTTSAPTVLIGGQPAQVSFSGLAPGFVGYYQVNAQVPASTPDGNAVPVSITIGGVTSNNVTMAVSASSGGGAVTVSPSSLQFPYKVGGTVPAGQSLQITYSGGGTLVWSATASATWLSVTPTSGTAPSSVAVSVVPAGLAAGSYSGTITISAPGVASQTVSVTLTVAPSAPTVSSLSPTSASAGGPAFTLTVTGSGFVSGSVVEWNGSSLTTTFVSATQLTATIPASDIATTGTAQVTVVNPAPNGGASSALTFIIANIQGTASSLTGTISAAALFGNNNVTGNVSISLSGVSTAGQTVYSATGIGRATAQAGGQTVYSGTGTGSGTAQCSDGSTGTWTVSLSLTTTVSPAVTSLVTNGGSVLGSSSLSGSGNLCNTPQNFSSNGTVTGIVTSGGAVALSSSGASSPQPTISPGGILNGAFNLALPSQAPGSIAAIFGLNLTDGTVCVPPNCGPIFDSNNKVIPILAGAQVSFNGIAAPILSTPGNGQLNVQIPVEVAGAASATVLVTIKGQSSPSFTVSLAPLSPGLISIDASGAGQGAILNDKDANVGIQSLVAPAANYANAHPATAGDVIEIYGTGLGAVTPNVATGMRPQGLPQTVTKPIVTIGGIQATVLFPGLAGCCVGLNQVNVVVPAGTPAGNAVPVVLTIGGVTSNTVTIAVQ